MNKDLFKECRFIFDLLENSGFECYAVGGCVRDYILGLIPDDIDFTTNALPDDILSCFKDYKTFEIGKKFGTISVLKDNKVYEITTYRIDGSYTDSRHPDKVEFSGSLKDDLARRDFTINAMAMDKNGRIIDYYGGLEDIDKKLIKAVGDPVERFSEDALRIFRALRFSAKLGFEIEEYTELACHSLAHTLMNVHPQRMKAEFTSFILSQRVEDVIEKYKDIIAVIIPELKSTFDFDQITAHHRYDVFTHTVKALGMAPQDLEIRLAIMFHDIAKPVCHFRDKAGISHFKGHPLHSSEMAAIILRRFAYPSELIENVCGLIKYHDKRFENRRPHIKKVLADIGEEGFEKLLIIQKFDVLAQSEYLREQKLELIDNVRKEFKSIITEGICIKLSDLDINGNVLVDLGFSGRKIGEILEFLLREVIYERLDNNRDELVKVALTFKDN